MSNSIRLLALVAALAATGCQTQAQFLQSKEGPAVQTALSRGRFELNCPSATGTVLSKEVTQPAVAGPYAAGIQRAEYTVGVAGCGQRMTYVVVCPEGGDSCFAGAGRPIQ